MTAIQNIDKVKFTREDLTPNVDVRWCPGCGDYSILAQMKKMLPELGVPKENLVFISGIGCSSRFPYYMDTYGFHTIHGRAAAIASGVKLANQDLKVFVMTGDGDGLSIGGNHFIHLCRRNIDITIVLFNNQIYGLTKGQYSPTSVSGQITKSSPYGTIENPFNPVKVALATGATFVARSIDREPKHLAEVLRRAAEHKGVSFVEVLQNCVIFNDGAFSKYTDPKQKKDNVVFMEHGKPFVFGQNNDKVLHWNGNFYEVKNVADTDIDQEVKHDDHTGYAAYECALATLKEYSDNMPLPLGIFRDCPEETYGERLTRQIEEVKAKKGEGTLEKLLFSGSTFEVK